MAETLTGSKIKKLVEEAKVIENGSLNNCGALKYDFTLSDEILKSDFSTPVKLADLSVEERRAALIQPGEVVYVLTKEKVNLPSDMYMSLSANRGMSEYGVLTLGGFAVDPGYSGRLMFGLFNYSSTPFTLMPGAKLIGGVFYQLDESESINIEKLEAPKPIEDFPARLVSIISKYSPTGMTSLEGSIEAISKQVAALKEELNNNKEEIFGLRHLIQETQEQTNRTSKAVKDISDNIKELAGSVNELKTDISDLKDSLKDEIRLRKDMRDDIDKQIELVSKKVDKKLAFIKGATWTLSAAVMILITLLTCWANGWLKFGG
ncbi:MAG: dCTP deaminase domain-containing protein [Lachnospiraceae bacterium]